jgi:hypothetical protein
MKALSVKQPHATLICAGVKRVENRTWTTSYRGRLLIHASGDMHSYPDLDCLPAVFADTVLAYAKDDRIGKAPPAVRSYAALLDKAYTFYGQDPRLNAPPEDWLKAAVKKHGFFMASQAIVGEVDLAGVVNNCSDDFAEPGAYHWLLDRPVLYDKPIINVIGRLRLWEFNKT